MRMYVVNSPVWLRGTVARAALALSALCAPQIAHAQAEAKLDEEEIVVTGKRRDAEVTEIGSRLGLTARETPATVEVIDSETIRREGMNTLVDTVRSAAGVVSADTAAHTPYAMRGFQMAQVSNTHNGINLGSTDFTGMNLNTFNLDRVEFLKGPSSIVSGQGAVGGTVNFVTKAPRRGPIESEVLIGVDSRGSLNAGFGSGGSIGTSGFDYRFDISRYNEKSFIEDSEVTYVHLSAGLDYHVSPSLKLFIAAEYRDLSGQVHWGTPLVPIAFSGPNATRNIVSGSYVSDDNRTDFGLVTIDRRTFNTNYNVLDNRKDIDEAWIRAGFDWNVSDAVTIRNVFFRYDANREWFNNELVAFNANTNLVDRERYFVRHDHRQVGNNLNLTWNTQLLGLNNRLVVALEYYDMDFVRPSATNYPSDSVSLVNPARGTYGPLTTALQTSAVESIAVNVENRIEITSTFALVGGLRYNRFDVDRTAFDPAGAARPGFPLSVNWDPVTGRVGFTWDVVPAVTFYGQYATASDVSVGSYFLLDPTQNMELSNGRSYEAGVKASFWNGRGQATLSLYDIKRSNVYSAAADQSLNIAGALKSRGVEFTASVRPTSDLRLWGNAAYTHARYNDYVLTSGESFDGNTPPNIPNWVLNAGGSYRLSDLSLPLELGATVNYVSDRFHTDRNVVTLVGYTTANVFAFVDLPEGLLGTSQSPRLSFRVKNVTNKRYIAYSDPFNPSQLFLGTPRTFETSLSVRF